MTSLSSLPRCIIYTALRHRYVINWIRWDLGLINYFISHSISVECCSFVDLFLDNFTLKNNVVVIVVEVEMSRQWIKTTTVYIWKHQGWRNHRCNVSIAFLLTIYHRKWHFPVRFRYRQTYPILDTTAWIGLNKYFPNYR